MNNHKRILAMTSAALMTAVICVLAPLSVPIGPVSITLQNFVLSLAAVILGAGLGTVACLLYLALGLVGVPVFSGYSAGPASFTGVTGGFLVGFIFFVLIGGCIASIAAKKFGMRSPARIIATILGLVFADAVLYAFGSVWFMVSTGASLSYTLSVCAVPFILPDLVKIVLASIIGIEVRNALVRAKVLEQAQA